MSSLVISLLIKEVVAAREVIHHLNETPFTNTRLAAALKGYHKTCDEVRKITQEQITGPLSAYEQERKTIRRYE